MLSHALMTSLVGAGTVAAFMWLGQFTGAIFEDASMIISDINKGKDVSNVNVISEYDQDRLKNFRSEVEAANNGD